MRTRLSKLFKFSWVGLLVIIIISGVMVSFGRLASPYLAEFKSDIENEISSLISSSVSIGKINTKWAGFGPKLELHNIVIQQGDDEASTLFLRQVDVDLAIKSFFKGGHFLPWNITLHGLSLRLTMDKDGKIQVVGMSTEPDTQGGDYSLAPLFDLRRIELADTQIFWIDETGRTPSTHFEHLHLLMRNDDDRHQLDLTFSIADEKNQNIKIAADIRADIDSLEKLDGEFYVLADNVKPINWLKAVIPANLVFHEATSTAEVWISADKGQIKSIQGQAEISNMSVQHVDSPTPMKLEKVRSEFNWRQNDGQLLFELNDFELTTADKSWPESRLYYRRKDEQAYLNLDHFNTDFWPDVLPFLPADKAETLRQVDVGGMAHNVKANWTKDFSNWHASLELENFSVTPALEHPPAIGDIQLPGIENLSGTLLASHLGGKLKIDSESAKFSQPGLFREPIPITEMSGELSWFPLDNDTWVISSEHLLANTPYIDTESRLLITLPKKGSIEVDLQTDFKNGDGSHASLYYPVGIMNANLVQWLDRSITSGNVTSGSFVLKGPIDDFAFSKTHNGRFEILFDVEDLILDYRQEWPRIEEGNARVRFLNNALFIKLFSGKILDTDISGATASIPSLHPIYPIHIQGETRGPASDNLRILSETTLKEKFATLADALSVKGNNRVNLDFKIPLGKTGDYELDGRVKFNDNRLSLNDWNLQFNKVNGELLFDLNGLSSHNLTAFTYGSKTSFKIEHDKKQNTLIKSRLSLNDKQIRKIIDVIPKDLVTGRSDWEIDLTIPPLSQKNNAVTLNLFSSLEGTNINAPEPFGKNLSSKQPLNVEVLIDPTPKLPITFTYSDDIQGKILLRTNIDDDPTLDAAQIHLGSSPMPDTRENHLQVSGSIDKVELDGWLDWIGESDTTQASMPVEINLQTDEMLYEDFALTQVNFQINQDKDKLSGSINSHQLAGTFNLDSLQNLQKVSINLDKAKIKLDSETEKQEPGKQDSSKQEPEKAGKVINPAKIPAISLIVKNLIINEEPIGKLLLETSRAKKGIKIDTLFLTGENLQADISGQWVNLGPTQKTDLIIDLNSPDMGKALKQLGFAQQIEQGEAEISGQLNWLDSPLNVKKSKLGGQLDLDIKKGRFMELEPGVGRILGILNIAALSRRLTLDFSDLFKDGFTFDEITGKFTFDEGNAYTDDMTIKSPSALIELSGRTGVATEDFDQVVTVTPSLQSGLTIAGAVAGGPAGAAIGFVAQKLIGNEVDKIARTRYKVEGPWDKPEITKLKKLSPVVEN